MLREQREPERDSRAENVISREGLGKSAHRGPSHDAGNKRQESIGERGRTRSTPRLRGCDALDMEDSRLATHPWAKASTSNER